MVLVRLTMYDLSDDDDFNILSLKERTMIWIPEARTV